MRIRLLLLAVLVLVVAGSAAAAGGGLKHFRVVKRNGSITAKLTYTERSSVVSDMILRIQRNGRPVLTRKICPLDSMNGPGCRWFRPYWWPPTPRPPLAFRRVAPANAPAAVVVFTTGGNHCCQITYIAVVGNRVHWITHDWGNVGSSGAYRGTRLGGRFYFVSGDGRFMCIFTSCAESSFPVQVWSINRAGRLVNVTRSVPGLIRADARRQWRVYLRTRHEVVSRGTGILAAWCADEYLLRLGSRCTDAVNYALAHGYLEGQGLYPGRQFLRQVNRLLERWGYRHS